MFAPETRRIFLSQRFGNEEVHFAQDVVQIDLLPDDLEGERGDDGQEQTQNENEQNTGEQDPTD